MGDMTVYLSHLSQPPDWARRAADMALIRRPLGRDQIPF
jgi:hypothetical protein